MAFVHEARSLVEDRVLAALARIQVAIPQQDRSAVANFCINEVILQGDHKTKRLVLNFFGFSDTVAVPIEVTYRRPVVEEASYSGTAVVSVDDLSVDKDGSIIIKRGATYHYEPDSLTPKKQDFRGEKEARYDDNASKIISWRTSEVKLRKNH